MEPRGGPQMKWLVALILGVALSTCSALQQRTLTVCMDPNNLPFSNAEGEGFENRLTEILAEELDAKLEYVWWAQRRGYVRNTLNGDMCDLWPGVASTLEMLSTTRPYYRSTYVFMTRQERDLAGLTLDDPRLRNLDIGVQLVGDDGNNTPPAHALGRRGLVGRVRGYMLYGNYRRPNPPADLVKAVESGEVDVGMVWGPLAGYFASQAAVPLRIEPVTPWLDDSQWPMVYDVSVGVKKDNRALLKEVDAALVRRSEDIRALLQSYHVPVVRQ